MYCGSPSSVTQVENCAESATTLAPQTAAIKSRKTGFAPKNIPTARQQLPLIAIAHEVTTVRPTLSAITPAAKQPTAPQPMTRNDATSASAGLSPCKARLARIITGTQVHIAYNSHMWPK